MSTGVNKVIDKSNGSKENVIEKSDSDSEVVDYDQLLCCAGEFGLYQVFMFFLTLPFYFFGVFVYFSQIFITETPPNHWCWIPELANLTDIERRNLAIPNDNSQFGYSRCESYVANWTEVLTTGVKPDATWEVASCKNGWEYNTTEIPYPTISSEMDWVCDKASYQATAQAFFFVGSIIGGFLVGWIADRYGRLPAAVLTNLIACIAGTATIFTGNFVQFTVCRFFMGMSYDNCIMMAYLLVLEYIAPRYRTLISNLTFAIFFTTAATLLPFIALACGHWKTIALVTSLPIALTLLAPLVMPESPRWLLSKGRVDDAVNKVLTIAKVNKKQIPPKFIEKFKAGALKAKNENETIMDLLKRPLMRRIFICISVEFVCCMVVYDALIRTMGQLQFDIFLSFSFTSVTEFPSLVLLSLILDYTGRKCMMTVSLFACAVVCFLVPVVGPGLPSVVCAVIARFFINMAWNTVVQWTAEVLPTSVRGSGTSVAHICGFLGTMVAPFVAYLDTYQYWLPMVVIGSISMFASVLAMTLPETARREMPQTFEAAEEMFRNQGFLDIPCFRKKTVNCNEQTGQKNQTFQMN